MKRESILLKEHPHLFGLSRTEPTLNEPHIPLADITEADVDIFLDELPGLNLKIVDASKEDASKDIYTLMSDARRGAVRQLEADLLAGLMSLYGTSKRRYAGSVGGNGQSQGVIDSYDGQLMTLRLVPKHAPGAVAVIKRIGVLVDSDVDVEVLVTGMSNPVVVVASADTPSYISLISPILVRLDEIEALEASFAASGFKPRHNLTSCGCTAMDSVLSDYFADVYNANANGILLDLEVYCDESGVLTANFDASIPLQDTIAYAARYKAGEILLEAILGSTQINRYTLLDREACYGKRNTYRKEYTDRLNWLVGSDGLDTSYSACYPCRPGRNDTSLAMGHILI